MAIDTAFFKHLEDVFPGPRHPRAQRREAAQPRLVHGAPRPRRGADGRPDQPLQHDVRPVLHGRQPGGLRPRTGLGRHQEVLDNAVTIKPRRQMSVQFSGGEPTMSPYFLDAIRYSRKVGYNSVQAATNGIEFAKSPEFAKAAAEAGLRYAYLQFDGIGNAANSHRRVGNLFDVKLRAIENLHSAGVDIVPVITIVNGVNNEQVGRVVEFALDNPKRINFLSFQPVSLHGPRRGGHAGTPRRAALHAVAPGARREEPDGHRRADSRLVPDLLHVHLHRLGGRRARTGSRLGAADLRLPPELRHRHGRDDRQGNEGSGAGHGVPEGRAAGQGRRAGQRRRPRPVPVGGRHGAGADAQLRLRSRRRRTSASPTC